MPVMHRHQNGYFYLFRLILKKYITFINHQQTFISISISMQSKSHLHFSHQDQIKSFNQTTIFTTETSLDFHSNTTDQIFYHSSLVKASSINQTSNHIDSTHQTDSTNHTDSTHHTDSTYHLDSTHQYFNSHSIPKNIQQLHTKSYPKQKEKKGKAIKNKNKVVEISLEINAVKQKDIFKSKKQILKKSLQKNKKQQFEEQKRKGQKSRRQLIGSILEVFDWMMRAAQLVKMQKWSYFEAVMIMETVIAKDGERVEHEVTFLNIQVYAICCLMIAFKFESPLKNIIDSFLLLINSSHFKCNKTQIIDTELAILKLLSFQIPMHHSLCQQLLSAITLWDSAIENSSYSLLRLHPFRKGNTQVNLETGLQIITSPQQQQPEEIAGTAQYTDYQIQQETTTLFNFLRLDRIINYLALHEISDRIKSSVQYNKKNGTYSHIIGKAIYHMMKAQALNHQHLEHFLEEFIQRVFNKQCLDQAKEHDLSLRVTNNKKHYENDLFVRVQKIMALITISVKSNCKCYGTHSNQKLHQISSITLCRKCTIQRRVQDYVTKKQFYLSITHSFK